jgi:2-methylcitrate synthase
MVERATKGLADIVAANTAISNVDAKSGTLSYRGYDIDQLVGRTSFEEVAHLLQRGALPGRADLAGYRAELAAARTSLGPAVDALLPAVATDEPMAALRTLVSALSAGDPDAGDRGRDANQRRAARLVAQLPVLVARYQGVRTGGAIPEPRADLGLAGNLLWQLGTDDADLAAILDRALVVLADHTMNASTFAARVCAATLSDLHSAVTAAIGTLKGPLHGGANESVLALLDEVAESGDAVPVVAARLEHGARIVGFGHRAYGGADPRAKHLRAMSQQLAERTGDRRHHELSLAVERAVAEAGGPPPNADFYAAGVYRGLGIPADLATPVLAVARMAGWTAHAMEQHADNRLIRPDAAYIGPRRQVWMPIQERL